MGVAVERGQNHRRTGLTIDYTRLLFPLSCCLPLLDCPTPPPRWRSVARQQSSYHRVGVSAIQGFWADQPPLLLQLVS
ncbi:hypothetical protein L2E82_12492 [Cichorium intybus]|uniref:Uncharacterized protein n=1 Tax=Cichorium intybus TaxID=13427 RepID=A0ACB9GG81_CICIN|nr:hypothetical protein L2E82_12492 [Cichorium intybus]